MRYRINKRYLAFFLFLLAFVIAFFYTRFQKFITPTYTYKIVNQYPHDPQAFTQGLVFDNGFLYESTGKKGQSSLRKVELETGKVLQKYDLPNHLFGEGIAIFENKIVQLTWQSHRGFVYDQTTFALKEEFKYSTEGWGLTDDGHQLIMSDGSANLYFLNPETFAEARRIEVIDKENPVSQLNELEYIEGKIYANIWQQDQVAIINPQTGIVEAWLDLTNLLDPSEKQMAGVLNGIAYDPKGDRLFVTGKNWPKIFEIKKVSLPGNSVKGGVEKKNSRGVFN